MTAAPGHPPAREGTSPAHTILRCRCHSTHDAVEATSARVGRVLECVALPEHSAFELRLALQEALANAAQHGNRGDPAKSVLVTCCSQADRVTLIVEDEGEGFDPDRVPDPTRPENLLKERGRGIHLMRRLADVCRFERGGRRVVIVKRIPGKA